MGFDARNAELVQYIQSANTLFHFTEKLDYMWPMLEQCAIIPRYFSENIEYLRLNDEKRSIQKISVLGTCFCDISFHKLSSTFHIRVDQCDDKEKYEQLPERERMEFECSMTHPKFYGEYGIALCKQWGEINGVQPVHYLNENSSFRTCFANAFNVAISSENLEDEISENIAERLAYQKPLKGHMTVSHVFADGSTLSLNIMKNFHDECEWRYVPSEQQCRISNLKFLLTNYGQMVLQKRINRMISAGNYVNLYLPFQLDDIRYLIVPDSAGRIELIKRIISTTKCGKCTPLSNALVDKEYLQDILISKILVLDDIEGDM